MSFFGDLLGNFTGNKAKNDLLAGYNRATPYLTRAREEEEGHFKQAQSEVERAREAAQRELDAGLATGRADIAGYGERGINALTAGRDAGRLALAEGRTGALNALTAGLGKATEYYQPELDRGRRYQATLDDVLGVNGAEGGQRATAAYNANPYLEKQIERQAAQMDRAARAKGQAESGAVALATARAGEEQRYADYTDWKNRITDQAARGTQVADRLAGLNYEAGKQEADIRTGTGAREAELESSTGQQKNQAFGSTGKALADLTAGLTGQKSKNALTAGQSIADILQSRGQAAWGYGTTMAGREQDLGNAYAKSRDTGFNNLMKIADTGVRAYAGFNYPRPTTNYNFFGSR